MRSLCYLEKSNGRCYAKNPHSNKQHEKEKTYGKSLGEELKLLHL
jgi:hypothetical protein